MINPEEIEALLKGAKAGEDQFKQLINELLHQFALTEKEGYEGAYPLILILYAKVWPVLKEITAFAHDIRVLEAQIMKYLELLGAPITDAESFLKDLHL